MSDYEYKKVVNEGKAIINRMGNLFQVCTEYELLRSIYALKDFIEQNDENWFQSLALDFAEPIYQIRFGKQETERNDQLELEV